ncbi:hypothetical protein HPB48_001378 [Haemaphysalis longicornis]|uniref:Uncharacterized protein n=1 Tax=Haemaphysalis longicornis TaxID=44386 RepID=A0A9J6FGL0_HAELO|nr:hypothetical protein HPB48_001378 [Haemaphysalis longicornis]
MRIPRELLIAALLLLIRPASAQSSETTTTPSPTTTTEEPQSTTPDAAEAVRQSWAKVESMLKSTVDTQLRRLLPQMLRASGEAGMSPECQAANFKVMLGLRQLKSWAIRREYCATPSLGCSPFQCSNIF